MNRVDNSQQNTDQLRDVLGQLDRLLIETGWLWRPQPFKQKRPPWCERLPGLCDELLALSEQELQQLSGDSSRLVERLSPAIPELKRLMALSDLPPCDSTPLQDLGPHFHSGIPGRKWQQIAQFARAVGPMKHPLLEWCGGKGHLGRLLAAQWQTPVVTIEHNEALCREGEQFAERAGVAQRFVLVDALSEEVGRELSGRHAVALHACGELHRNLIRESLAAAVEAFDIAPCCYYLGAGEVYQPFSDGLQLTLSRDDLRLAVTETVTAAGREVERRDREMAWKLGYGLLCDALCGEEKYRPIKPINKAWLNLGFEGFCRQLAARDGQPLAEGIAWSHYEELGWQRQHEVMRLGLVRAAFRRALEMWLVLDMANYIAGQGYRVALSTFCDRELTPRNVLISARRA